MDLRDTPEETVEATEAETGGPEGGDATPGEPEAGPREIVIGIGGVV